MAKKVQLTSKDGSVKYDPKTTVEQVDGLAEELDNIKKSIPKEWSGSMTEYGNLDSYDDDTIYFIYED